MALGTYFPPFVEVATATIRNNTVDKRTLPFRFQSRSINGRMSRTRAPAFRNQCAACIVLHTKQLRNVDCHSTETNVATNSYFKWSTETRSAPFSNRTLLNYTLFSTVGSSMSSSDLSRPGCRKPRVVNGQSGYFRRRTRVRLCRSFFPTFHHVAATAFLFWSARNSRTPIQHFLLLDRGLPRMCFVLRVLKGSSPSLSLSHRARKKKKEK